MSDSIVQTLFRCGVCMEMFASSDECYSHIVNHEFTKTTEQETVSVQSEHVAEAEDDVIQETVADEIEEENEIPEEETTVEEPQMVNVVSFEGDSVSTNVIEKVEGGVTVSVTSTDQASVSDMMDKEEVGASAKSGDESASELWVGKVGGVLQVQKVGGRSTNEDLDIADILINIKQEKPEELPEQTAIGQETVTMVTKDLMQLANQVAKANGKVYDEKISKDEGKETLGKKTVKTKSKLKKKKALSTQLKVETAARERSDPIPVVRRKKKGEENDENDDTSYGCSVCGKRYAILKSLKYHERTHDTERLLYCDICNKGFVKPSELSNHQRSHLTKQDHELQDIDMFKCQYCDKEYRIKKSLKHHEKVHELGKRFTCETCNKTFFKPSDLERHKKVHQPLAKCYICSKPFRDPKKLEVHVRQHPELLLQQNEPRLKSASSLTQCKYCNKKCTTFSSLCNHVRTHTKRKPFPCDVCGKMFNRVSNMRLHRKLHSGNKPFHCNECGVSFADFANRNRHMKKYHDSSALVQMAYKPRCSKVVVVDNLAPAPKLKIQRETLVNELCSAYEDLNVLKKDEEPDDLTSLGQKGKNLIQCREVQGIPQQVQEMITVGDCQIQLPPKDISSPGVDLPEATSEQVYVVFEDNPSVCYVLEYEGEKPAGKASGSQGKAKTEQTTISADAGNHGPNEGESVDVHNIENDEEEDGGLPLNDGDESENQESPETSKKLDKDVSSKTDRPTLRRHACSFCGLRFKHQGSLKFHIKKHTKEGVMYCEVCNAEFYRKSRLRIHMRDHTGERPYKCSECELTFKVHYDLTVHMRQHTGFGALQCSHCDKIFYTRRALNSHLRNQSKEKPFSCSRCGKLFKRKDQRRRHMLIHVGEMPFKCHMCDRSFGDSSNRKRHIIKNHGNSALETLPKGRISLVRNLKI